MLGTLAAALWSPVAHADAPALQVAPLEYDDTLRAGHIEQGFVDVANPGDASIEVASQVRGFKQTGTSGDLEFFDDPDLARAITVSLTDFSLGAREAVRVTFTVDPAKLPAGGVYAAIFFRTVPPAQISNSSYVAESANVGMLLVLTNGTDTTHHGQLSRLDLPFWQFGSALSGSLQYRNTDAGAHPVGFTPRLTVRITPWGKARQLNTGLVLPGITREFPLVWRGDYFGPLPVIITDADTHTATVTWIFAYTGWSGLWVIIAAIVLVLAGATYFARRRRRKPTSVKRRLDGLSAKR